MPFCPQCRYEYIEGIQECPDCRIGLVAELPAGPAAPPLEGAVHLVTIYSTYDPFEADLVQGRLRGAGFDCWLKTTGILRLYPIHVQVMEFQEAQARQMLEESIDLRPVFPEVSGRELEMVAPPARPTEEKTGRELAWACGERGFTGRELTPSEEGEEGRFCPQCGYEYLPEVLECPDCRVRLVAGRPAPETEPEEVSWSVVYETVKWGEALLVRSLLEGSGLPVLIGNRPAARAPFPLATGGFRLQVPTSWVEAAQELLEAAWSGEQDG